MGNYKPASGQLQNSRQLQNNTANGAMSISVSRVIKEINRLRKEISRLFGKGISNIYIKVTIEKK